MHTFSKISLLFTLGLSAFVQAAPTLNERSSCTFSGSSGAASAIKNKKSCSTIVLSNVVVPAGETLDLTGLNKGTKVNGYSKLGSLVTS